MKKLMKILATVYLFWAVCLFAGFSVASTPKANPVTGKTFFEEYNEASGKLKLKVFANWVRANPITMFEELRKVSPILEMKPLPIEDPQHHDNQGTYVVSLYHDVVEVLDHPTIFSVRNYTQKMESSVGPFMLAQDGGKKFRDEKEFMHSVMPHTDLEKVIRPMVKRLTEQAIKNGTYIAKRLSDGSPYAKLELVNQVARKVPLQLTGEYFGFPGPNLETLARWSRATQDDFFHNVKNDNKVHDLAVQAGREMTFYLRMLVNAKRNEMKNGKTEDDVLSRMLRQGGLVDDRIISNTIGTLVGGVETTQAAIVQSVEKLFATPTALGGLRNAIKQGDDKAVASYVWEALRFNPVNPFVVRYAEQDYILGKGTPRQTVLKKGSIVLAATQSAMFDEAVINKPLDFRTDRADRHYFHLGWGHHRCLGDYVSMIQVPEIVKAIVSLEEVMPVDGHQGQVDNQRTGFPESFVVEYKVPTPVSTNKVQVVDPRYAYEDYLTDYNRSEYRTCLMGESSVHNIVRHFRNDHQKALFWCRLSEGFRQCMQDFVVKEDEYQLIASPNKSHETAFQSCVKQVGMTTTEKIFYNKVILEKDVSLENLPTVQAGKQKWEFENYITHYNRRDYRECFMNPKGKTSFPNDEQMIFYARLPITFRMCMGFEVVKHEKTGGRLGKSREDQYEICKNGLYNGGSSLFEDIVAKVTGGMLFENKTATGRLEGGLSKEEKYFYETLVLKRNIPLSKIKDL